MQQTTLCVPLEVKPESCERLSKLIDDLKTREDKGVGGAQNFGRLIQSVPTLHFMSMSVFPAAEYDPLFILEANFDGPPGPFWGQLEALLGQELREMLRCCKPPLDDCRVLYDTVTAPQSRASVAAYMEARTQRPSVFHHGNRGLGCDDILNDYALFRDVRDALDEPSSGYHGLQPGTLHQRLRAAVRPAHPWLDQPAPERITRWENVADWARMIVFVVATLLVLSAPGVISAALLPWRADLIAMFLLSGVLWALAWRYHRGLPAAPKVKRPFSVARFVLGQYAALLLVGAIILASWILIALVIWPSSHVLSLLGIMPALSLGETLKDTLGLVALGILGLVLVVLPWLLATLRFSENRDSSQDAPHVNARMLHDMLRREDWVTQNHMGSIVLIKPGILRTILLTVGHRGLGLLLRIQARDGYLGSMRTVHFAHWAFLNNGSRLLFFSNFDHSWGSYLDDFIEKAHAGLTLAWTCGVGFPPTRFLLEEGATHGRQFKTWALASRAVSRFWFSAYPDLTVDQIERNHRIACGLRKPTLENEEAKTWMRDL